MVRRAVGSGRCRLLVALGLAASLATPLALLASPSRARGGPGYTMEILQLQVLLDRAHFSPGEIDGQDGSNTRRALAAFRENRKLADAGTAQEALAKEGAAAVIAYAISEGDLAGPFEEAIPEDMMEKAQRRTLGFTSPLEALSERFHCSPRLLQELNPGAAFDRAGTRIKVPNVHTALPPPAAKLVVDQSDRAVYAMDAQGAVLVRYPATMGSEHDPLPLGAWKVTGIFQNPKFHYNPDLFWDAEPGHAKATLPPGANNPVGVVWIDLSKEHFGIHGTPEPSTVGKTQSHGCIRLTNWDAQELAGLLEPGTPALLQE
jgi:lipoprotein-anchoring transpeptidase ErfK/SrfK